MTIDQLRRFVAVAQSRSLTETARNRHLTQGAISHQIKKLEAEFGQAFIKGNGRGVELTEKGKNFFPDAEVVLSGFDEFIRKYSAKPQKSPAETLAIGASHATSEWLVPRLMGRFRQSHPAVALDLSTGSSAKMEKLLVTSKVDIALVTRPSRSAKFHVEPLRGERLAAFVRRDHPLAKKRKIAAQELARFSLVIRQRRSGKNRTDELLADLAKIGLKPRVAMRFESGEAVKSAVRNGSGVGILYRDVIKAEVSRKEFAILPLVGTISRPGVIFFTPKRSRLRGRQNNFSCSCARPSEAIARSDVQRKFRVSRSTRKPELGTRNRSCHRHRALDAGFLKLVLVVFPNVQVFVGVFDHHMVDGRAFQRKVESILSRIRGVKPKYASAASNRRTRSCS